MKNWNALRFAACFALLPAAMGGLSGCSPSSEAPEGIGRLDLPLRAASPSGTVYRLVNGWFDVAGPESRAVYGDIEATSTVSVTDLPVGAYSVGLRPGWQIQRELANGGLLALDATLLSPASQPVQIAENATSSVTFRFQVGEEVVEFGQGQLNINFEVEVTNGPTCGAPQVACSGVCVDTSADENNCGACGQICPAASECAGGSCVPIPPQCLAPLVNCGGPCVDVSSDPANCGGCGIRCDAGESCQLGACATVGGGGGNTLTVPLDPGGFAALPWGPAQWLAQSGVDDCPGCIGGTSPFSSVPPGPGMCVAGGTTQGDFGDFTILGLVSPLQIPMLPPTFTGVDLTLNGVAPATLRLIAIDSTSRQAEVELGANAGLRTLSVSATQFACAPWMPPEQCLSDLGEATGLFLLIPGGVETAGFNLCTTNLTIRY